VGSGRQGRQTEISRGEQACMIDKRYFTNRQMVGPLVGALKTK